MPKLTLGLLLALAAVLAYAHWPTAPLAPGTQADALVVDKSDRTLWMMRDGEVLHAYAVSLGGAPAGPKRYEGDERTPEGTYCIDWRNERSRYFRALHVSYPDASDRARGQADGKFPGGDIMIHGLANGFGFVGRLHRLWDWTDGCIAVTNAEMAQIWDHVPNGTPIALRP